MITFKFSTSLVCGKEAIPFRESFASQFLLSSELYIIDASFYMKTYNILIKKEKSYYMSTDLV